MKRARTYVVRPGGGGAYFSLPASQRDAVLAVFLAEGYQEATAEEYREAMKRIRKLDAEEADRQEEKEYRECRGEVPG